MFHLVLESHDGRALVDSEEKREPESDIDTAVVDSLKVLDPKRPIREADIAAVSAIRDLWRLLARALRGEKGEFSVLLHMIQR